jgi:hypothetical protein
MRDRLPLLVAVLMLCIASLALTVAVVSLDGRLDDIEESP